MGWRELYSVHPSADVLPMMSDEELAKLGEDILANGQKHSVLLWSNGQGTWLIDGRNRLEAMERVGMDPAEARTETFTCKDPATHIISLNIHRRHLTKEQAVGAMFAIRKAAEEVKPRQSGEVSTKGGRGKINTVKAALVGDAAKVGISKRTVERVLAKAEGKKLNKPKLGPKRRASTRVKAFREGFLIGVEITGYVAETYMRDEALDLLAIEEKAFANETIKRTIASLTALLSWLK